MSKCTILAHVRNSKGEIVVSRLYKDLLHYTSNNRALTKEYYAVGTNPEFLSRVRNEAIFDENGEITFKSLKKLANLDTTKEVLLATLNKDLGAGEMSYDEAVGRLTSFNKNSQYNDSYMATITFKDNGQYQLSVVEKTPANIVSLKDTLSERSLQDRIKYRLTQAGVAVDFIENDEKINGRYSTKNATKTADSLYHLIQILNGTKIDETLAEEAGHFVVGAMKDSPLIERLLNLLTNDVQREILGNDYVDKYMGDSARRETAGTLVGRALQGNIDIKSRWGRLLGRIVDQAKRIFATITEDQVLKDSIEAKQLAEKLAEGFMSDTFEGTVENALSVEETLYNAPASINVKTYRHILNRLRLQASQMRNIDEGLFKKYKNIAGQVELGRDNNVNIPGTLADAISLEGIAEAVSLMSDLMVSEIPDLLQSVDFANISDFYQNMPRNAKALRVVRTYLKNALSIIDIIEKATSNLPGAESLRGNLGDIQILDAAGNNISLNLIQITDNLKKILTQRNGIAVQLANKESQFYLKFLEDTLGTNYISRAARCIFNFKKGENILKFKDTENIPVSEYLSNLEGDISFFEKWLSSMSNSSDIIGQVADRAVKYANKIADDSTRVDFERLQGLKERYEFLKKSKLIEHTRDIYEIGRDGKLTGNILSEDNFGDWEADFEEFKKQAKEDFKTLYPDIQDKPDFERGLIWESYFKPLIRSWHKSHSVYKVDPQTGSGTYMPNTNYHNIAWDSLDIRVQNFISGIQAFKVDIDNRLPDGFTKFYRMPQFKGTFITKVGNKRLIEGKAEAITHTLLGEIRDTFCESSDDTEYGCNTTYNSQDEELFHDALTFEREKLNRVPIYGINKIKDTTELSTDIFHSLLAYSGMANSFAALNAVADTLEVGTQVLSQRRVGGLLTEEERVKSKQSVSNAFSRYTKFLDKQVYGIGTEKIKIGDKLVLNKILGFFTGLASKVYLGGNVAGGLVNLGTGFIEMAKEAGVGEEYTIKQWTRAIKEYNLSLPHILWDSAKEYTAGDTRLDNDKVSLFIEHFNTLGENKRNWREWHTQKAVLLNFFSDSLWFPYKSGEHFMQTVPYIAMAIGTPLYYKDTAGNLQKTNLWDAYQVEASTESVRGKSFNLTRTYFKNPTDIDTYHMLADIVRQIDNALASTSLLGGSINLTQEQSNYISTHGYNLANLEDTKTALLNDMNQLKWSNDDEASFQNRTRETCNRLHGIYNEADKTAFQQNIYGNMLLAMRGYALGMMERRFGQSKYNISLGKETGGSVSDLAKVIASMFTDKGGFALTTRALLLPFSNKTKTVMLQAGFSEHQYRNMRRNFGDMAVIAMLALIKYMTIKPEGGDDDEEEDNTALGLCYYFSSRLLREQRAFNTLRGIKDESSSLLDLEPIGISVLSDMWYISSRYIGQQFVEPSDTRLVGDEKPENYTKYYYNSEKEGLYTYGDSKAERKFWRMFPYVRSTYVFERPYDAAASFDYGRKVNN